MVPWNHENLRIWGSGGSKFKTCWNWDEIEVKRTINHLCLDNAVTFFPKNSVNSSSSPYWHVIWPCFNVILIILFTFCAHVEFLQKQLACEVHCTSMRYILMIISFVPRLRGTLEKHGIEPSGMFWKGMSCFILF